jgi:hypothetical protein
MVWVLYGSRERLFIECISAMMEGWTTSHMAIACCEQLASVELDLMAIIFDVAVHC